MTGDPAEWRRAERLRLLAGRDEPDAETHARWSAALTSHLAVSLGDFAGTLGIYSPHRREYDPTPIGTATIARGGKAAMPVVLAKRQPLEYREWYPGIAMIAAKLSFGIPHPAQGDVLVPDIMLVPLLGFDRAGYRLGYGGGYFDRTLAAYPVRPKTIGVGFETGRLHSIDPQPHDIAMDAIVTEAGIFQTR